MPARKRKIARKKSVSKKARSTSGSSWRWGESYTSLLLGIVVVIVAVLFGVSIFKQTKHVQQTSSIQTSVAPTNTPTPTPGTTVTQNGQKMYIVKSGDSLWTIAESFYKSGYNWVDIAKANNLANPDDVFAGNQLVIPNVAPKTLTVVPAPLAAHAITTNSYTVVKGDDLWDIAVRAYGDGYKWVEIARANNLANPDMIFSGNVLTLPR